MAGRSPPRDPLTSGSVGFSSGSKWWATAAPASVGSPAVAVVGRLVGLGFLGDGAALAALPRATLVFLLALAAQYHLQIWKLPILLQVVVEDLRVGLLMRGQDVHERSGGVCRCRCRVDGAAAAQRRRQIEGGCRGSSVKSLLLEGLLSFGVDGARDVWHSCITGCHGYTSAVSVRAIAAGLLKRGC